MPGALLIATGDELVSGKTVNTSSAVISRALDRIGITVHGHVTVKDRKDDINRVLDTIAPSVDLVVITGGLGPTDDDVTMETIAERFGLAVKAHEPSRQKMEDFFASRKLAAHSLDEKMISIPEGSTALGNGNGLAPGFIVDVMRPMIAVLPGPPHECEAMMTQELVPYVMKRFELPARFSFQFHASGIRESVANDLIKDAVAPYPELTWGITVGRGTVRVTIDSMNNFDFQNLDGELRRAFGSYALEAPFVTPEEELLELCNRMGYSLAVAESCTGGMVASRLTDIAGSSRVFRGGIIAYDNAVKSSLLGVSGDLLEKHGAVSRETALAMARGVTRVFASDLGIAITGIAGPGGGSAEKPVGTVWFAFVIGHETSSEMITFGTGRDLVRNHAANWAINTLRFWLKK